MTDQDSTAPAAVTPDAVPTESPIRPDGEHASSLVLVNTGDGKGKTTAALGTLMRAHARGWKVCVVQFLKSEDWHVGEEDIGRELGWDWWTMGDGFSWDSENLEKSQAIALAAWQHAAKIIAAGEHDVVMLDEITYPMNWGWFETSDVVASITNRPKNVYIIATGRDAPQELVDVADTVTEMAKVKHAYDAGIMARRGFDF